MMMSDGQLPRDALKINAVEQWCLRKLLGIKWYHHVWNDDVRQTRQPSNAPLGRRPSTASSSSAPLCVCQMKQMQRRS